jgi:hypothetical protein
MEFISISGVHDEFYGIFLEDATENFLPDTVDTNFFLDISGNSVLIKHAFKGGQKEFQETLIYYPAIIIKDFVPKIDKQRALFVRDYYEGGFSKIVTPYETLFYAEKIYFPVPLEFFYQVSVVSKIQTEHASIMNWFYSKFYNTSGSFLLNKTETEIGDLGVVVPYTIDLSDVPREDGVYEFVVDFKLKTYVTLKFEESQLAISKIKVILETTDIVESTNYLEEILSINLSNG